MIKITFPDGNMREYEKGTSLLDIASSISRSLKKEVLCAKVNGEVKDIRTKLNDDASIVFCKFEDIEGKKAFWHTSSHILAQGVKRLYPSAKLAIGPSIDNGFYYDIDLDKSLTESDLLSIEKEMRKIVKENLEITSFTLPRGEALDKVRKENEDYKAELIEDLPEDEIISFYSQGEFTDLCSGHHLLSTGSVKALKLTSIAGAYWRGSEKNKMLQRIYGITFPKAEMLEDYIYKMEEAKKRDHRKIGKELDLFSILEEGPGFPFFHPKGMIIRNELENFWRIEHEKRNYEEIKTPVILDSELWKKSGHWDNYKENMYFTQIDEREFAIKPMNCPGGMLVYKRKIYSYKDLPVRMGELGLVHRHEKSGALHGLMRVRNFTQDDAHIFMREDQIKDEIKNVIDFTDYIYNVFNFKYTIEVSTKPEKAIGSDEQWDIATTALITALEEKEIPFKINEGDGAFYGPKIDFHLEDSIGRTWQCGTVQLDFQLPERFDLSYIGSDGNKHRPVVIHRVIYGSIERFIGILTEHFAGAFPTWLNPMQVKIISINEDVNEYCYNVLDEFKKANIRTEVDDRFEKLGFKIREAQMEKVPYMLVVGGKEKEGGLVSVRKRGFGDIGTMSVNEAVKLILNDIETKGV